MRLPLSNIDKKLTALARELYITNAQNYTCNADLFSLFEALPLFLLLTLLALLQVFVEALLLLSKGLQSCIALVVDDELHGLLPAPVAGYALGCQQLLEGILGLLLSQSPNNVKPWHELQLQCMCRHVSITCAVLTATPLPASSPLKAFFSLIC